MAIKKMRAKTKKNISKRIKVTANGSLLVNRSNHCHLRIKKNRKQLLKYKRDTKLSTAHDKLKTAI